MFVEVRNSRRRARNFRISYAAPSSTVRLIVPYSIVISLVLQSLEVRLDVWRSCCGTSCTLLYKQNIRKPVIGRDDVREHFRSVHHLSRPRRVIPLLTFNITADCLCGGKNGEKIHGIYRLAAVKRFMILYLLLECFPICQHCSSVLFFNLLSRIC